MGAYVMLKKYSAEKMGYKTEIKNAITVARDFLTLVSTYGEIGCINHRAPSDQRFKLTRNGSYYELADYCFVYNFIRNKENDGVDIYWTFADYDATVVYHGERMLRGDAYIKHMLTYGD